MSLSKSPAVPPVTPELEAEHQALRAQLVTRISTTHFAHCSVAVFVGLIFAGAAGRLWWDFEGQKWIELFYASVIISSVSLTYALVRYLLGRSALAREVTLLERLKVLRAQLGVDDPNVLLPASSVPR